MKTWSALFPFAGLACRAGFLAMHDPWETTLPGVGGQPLSTTLSTPGNGLHPWFWELRATSGERRQEFVSRLQPEEGRGGWGCVIEFLARAGISGRWVDVVTYLYLKKLWCFFCSSQIFCINENIQFIDLYIIKFAIWKCMVRSSRLGCDCGSGIWSLAWTLHMLRGSQKWK